jgi:hypothetical protein
MCGPRAFPSCTCPAASRFLKGRRLTDRALLNPSSQFVYPFTLEPHVLEHSPAHRAQAHASQAAHVALLLRRETERHERERKERMRLAPGWAGGQGLVPVRKATAVGAAGGGADAAPSMAAAGAAPAGQAIEEPKESSLEDDLRSLALGSSGAAAPEPSLATKAADDLGGAGVLL